MRRSLTLALTQALLLAAAPLTTAAKPPPGEKAPARATVPTPPTPRRAVLKSSVTPAPAGLRPRRADTGLQRSPPLRTLAEQGVAGGTLGAQPLVGLRSSTDAAPQCRATCARARYFCSAGGDDSCSDGWRQCVLGCRAR